MSEVQHRKVRSFVRRSGRTTKAQARALEMLWPRWGIDFTEHALDLDAAFGRTAPRVLDIGFGDGEALLADAATNPEVDYLGVEVHEPGIGHLLVLLERARIGNVRIVRRDVVDVMANMLPDRSFDVVNLFFPDPWPKKRHHKRRLVQPPFVAEVARVLKPAGLFHVVTDWADYALHIRDVLAQSAELADVPAADLCKNPLAFRAPTKFERRGHALGHEVAELYYRKRIAPDEDTG